MANAIEINGETLNLDTRLVALCRIARRRFARMSNEDRLAVIEASEGWTASAQNGTHNDESPLRWQTRFEERIGIRDQGITDTAIIADAIDSWWNDGYSFFADGSQRA